jgi:hypothetical protein
MASVLARSPLAVFLVGLSAAPGGIVGCQKAAEPERASSAAREGPAPPAAMPPVAASPTPLAVDLDPTYHYPAAERLVAIGDLHGDLAATRRALRLAGATDPQDRWIGGKLVVVQTGDELDRGDSDRQIVELFDRLADAAQAAGGRVRPLIGNHEAMNVSTDFRYVTPGGFAAFADTDTSRVPRGVLEQLPVVERGRAAAFLPGGPFARRLGERDTIAVVGDTVFVHGGVTVAHVRYGIGRLNREVKRWMQGSGAQPGPIAEPEGPVWTRRYSDDKAGVDCAGLGAALSAVGAKRMVVGHTPHEEGVSSACDGRVWRIDTGLSSYYGGPAQALEIRGDTVSVLRSPSAAER